MTMDEKPTFSQRLRMLSHELWLSIKSIQFDWRQFVIPFRVDKRAQDGSTYMKRVILNVFFYALYFLLLAAVILTWAKHGAKGILAGIGFVTIMCSMFSCFMNAIHFKKSPAGRKKARDAKSLEMCFSYETFQKLNKYMLEHYSKENQMPGSQARALLTVIRPLLKGASFTRMAELFVAEYGEKGRNLLTFQTPQTIHTCKVYADEELGFKALFPEAMEEESPTL